MQACNQTYEELKVMNSRQQEQIQLLVAENVALRRTLADKDIEINKLLEQILTVKQHVAKCKYRIKDYRNQISFLELQISIKNQELVQQHVPRKQELAFETYINYQYYKPQSNINQISEHINRKIVVSDRVSVLLRDKQKNQQKNNQSQSLTEQL